MRLTEIISADCVKIPLASTDKRSAIAEMVELVAASGKLRDRDLMLQATLEREATRTTGIGNGLAIPHGKCTGVDHLVVAIGKPETPIDFESIDKRPVNLIVLLASPPDQTGPHIQALARISRLMNVEAFRQAMRAATNAQQVYDAVVAQESTMGQN
jgi:fructose-specific phosphotransferase system IIA component